MESTLTYKVSLSICTKPTLFAAQMGGLLRHGKSQAICTQNKGGICVQRSQMALFCGIHHLATGVTGWFK